MSPDHHPWVHRNDLVHSAATAVFLNYGDFYPTHQKTKLYDYLIDLKFGTDNYWHKTMKNAKVQKISCSIVGNMTS